MRIPTYLITELRKAKWAFECALAVPVPAIKSERYALMDKVSTAQADYVGAREAVIRYIENREEEE